MPDFSVQFFNPFFRGEKLDNTSSGKFFWRLFFVFIGIFGFTLCLTSLYLAMRGVMNIGGFVAYGGPYHIAHQAPNWVWIFPASILCGVLFIFLNQFNARHIGGLNLLVLLFPAVFLSLGENFLEFGFKPPGQEPGVAIAWIVCGVLFMAMGGIPLFIIIKNTFKSLTRKDDSVDSASYSSSPHVPSKMGSPHISRKTTRRIVILINLAAVISGLYLGYVFFQKISS
jgi:hypothetical protein